MAWFAAMGRRLVLPAVLCLAAILLALGALGVGLGALQIVLATRLGAAASLSLVAAVLAALALAAGLAAYIIAGPQRRQPSPAVGPAEPISGIILADLAQGLRGAITTDPAAALLGALAAGFIAGDRPGPELVALVQLVAAAQEKAGKPAPRRR